MKQLFFFILISSVGTLTAETQVYVAPSNVAPSVYVEPGVVPGAGVNVPGAGGVHYEGWGGHGGYGGYGGHGYEHGYEHGYHEGYHGGEHEGYHGGEHGNWNHEEHHEGHEGHHEGHEGHEGHGGGHRR